MDSTWKPRKLADWVNRWWEARGRWKGPEGKMSGAEAPHTSQESESVNRFSRVQLFVTPWTIAHQAPLSMGFPRQYWSGLPFPPEDLLNPGIKSGSPELQGDSLSAEPAGKPIPLRPYRKCGEMENNLFSVTPFRNNNLWGWKAEVADEINNQCLESVSHGLGSLLNV